jgi:hypothetical protein
MGLPLYKRTRWHDDALLFSGWMRLYRGKIFARCVYNNTNARNEMTMRCCFSGWLRLYRGKILASWAYKAEHGIPDLISFMPALRARNPVFWPKWGIKNRGFRALLQRYKRNRWHDDAFFLDGCVCIEVKYWQDVFTPIQTHAMTWRCVAFVLDGFFVKYLQDKFRKIQTHAMTRRCVAFLLDGCVYIFVKYLQDGFTPIQTHAMTWRRCVAFLGMDAFV